MEKCLTNARPTTSRACCCVFYRLARRAGVDVRAPYCAARLLSRILPPRQARGRRRSRVLPRRALAVAYSTASPGARGSPPLSRRQEHTRSRAQSRPLRLQMRTRRFQRNPLPVVVSRKTSGCKFAKKKQVRRKRAEAFSHFSQDLDFFPPHNLRLLVEGLPTGFDWSTRSPDQRGFPDLWNRVSQASPLPGSGGPSLTPGFCSPRALDRPGSDRGTIPRGRATPGARVARVLYRLARRAGDKLLVRGSAGRVHSWVWKKNDLRPTCVYVKFDGATWQLDGAPEPGLYPVYPARKVWKLDAKRKKPVLKIARTQLPLAPAYREDVLILRRRTIERKREGRDCKACPGRPFERWLNTRGAPEGPALLLKQLRGEEVDWDAFREAKAPSVACEKCKEAKTLDYFSDRQGARQVQPLGHLPCLRPRQGRPEDAEAEAAVWSGAPGLPRLQVPEAGARLPARSVAAGRL